METTMMNANIKYADEVRYVSTKVLELDRSDLGMSRCKGEVVALLDKLNTMGVNVEQGESPEKYSTIVLSLPNKRRHITITGIEFIKDEVRGTWFIKRLYTIFDDPTIIEGSGKTMCEFNIMYSIANCFPIFFEFLDKGILPTKDPDHILNTSC